jgi:hypothetical protein
MPIEIAALATTVVTSFLLPYLKEGAKKIAGLASEKFGDSAGEYAAGLAEKVWNRVKSAFSSDRDKATLADLQENPEATASLMENKLKAKLEQDPTLKKELEELLNSLGPDGKSTGAQILGATKVGLVDLRGGTVSGGIVGGIVEGYVSPPQTSSSPGTQPPRER